MIRFLSLVSLLTFAITSSSGVLAQSKNDTIIELAQQDGKKLAPAVVLLHGCGGLRSHITEDWPEFFKSLGYITRTPDTLSSQGVKFCSRLKKPDMHIDQANDAYSAFKEFAAIPEVDKNRIFVMGFSMGAITIHSYLSQIQRSSEEGIFKAAIAVYGRCHEGPYKLGVPLLHVIAGNDVDIKPCVEATKNPGVEGHILKDAYHAFDNREITRMRTGGKTGVEMLYSEEATEKARAIIRDFLAKQR